MDKTNPNGRTHDQAALMDAVEALNRLRNSLVELSLFMKDYQFRKDSALRVAVDERAQELIDKVRCG